jgi:hypothetical protein
VEILSDRERYLQYSIRRLLVELISRLIFLAVNASPYRSLVPVVDDRISIQVHHKHELMLASESLPYILDDPDESH